MAQEIDPSASSLFMDFARYFDLSIATTATLRTEVYRVRYRVYCEEFGYEPAEEFSDPQEVDEFDDRSVHCLVVHRESKRPAGCVRLVTVDDDSLMPLESHCGDSLDHAFFEQFADRRHTMCEISRLAVDGAFRRRKGEEKTRYGDTAALHFSAREKRTFSLIAVSLFLAAAACADLLGRKNAFAIMEPFLPAILRRSGIHVKRVGSDFEYRGIRAPYYQDIDKVVEGMPKDLQLCYQIVRHQFSETLAPQRGRKASRNTSEPETRPVDDASLPWLRPGFA